MMKPDDTKTGEELLREAFDRLEELKSILWNLETSMKELNNRTQILKHSLDIARDRMQRGYE
jgi:hypothetical protein